jgi:hypothetical protein
VRCKLIPPLVQPGPYQAMRDTRSPVQLEATVDVTPSRPQAKPRWSHLQRQQHCDDLRVRCAPDSMACSCTAVAPWAAVAREPALRAPPWRKRARERANLCAYSATCKSLVIFAEVHGFGGCVEGGAPAGAWPGLRMRQCWYLDRLGSDVRLTPVWTGCCATAADFRCPGN